MKQTTNCAIKLHAELLAEQAVTKLEKQAGCLNPKIRVRILDAIERKEYTALRNQYLNRRHHDN